MLPREMAKKLILTEIRRRIIENPAWRQAVHDVALRAWDEFQSDVPIEHQAAQVKLREIERMISNLVDQIELGSAPSDVTDRLALRRDEKDRLLRQTAELQRRVKRTPQPLSPEQIDEALTNLHKVLSAATPAAAIALGNLIGDVVVRQASRPRRSRPFLRGEFVLSAWRVVNTLNGMARSEPSNTSAERGVTSERIEIEFVDADPKYEQSDLVKQLRDRGSANWQIAEQLDLSYSRVTYLWRFWYERRELPIPDRGDRPKRKLRDTPLYRQIADVAQQRWEKGDSESEIGRDFKTTQATVRDAITWWHKSRNLPVPRFKDRRQTQVELVGNMRDAGSTLAEISEHVKKTITTVRKMLSEWYALKGEVRPDGRTQPHRRKRSA